MNSKVIASSLLQGLVPLFFLVFFWQTRVDIFSLYEVYDYLIPFVYLSDILLVFLLSLTFILRPAWLFDRMRALQLSTVLAGVFFISALVGVLFALHPVSAWYKLIKLIIFSIFILWIVEIADRWSYSRVISIISLGLIPLAFIGWGEFLLGRSLGLQWIGEWAFTIQTPGVAKTLLWGEEWLRAYSVFPHPNVYGGIMAIFALLWLSRTLKARISGDSLSYRVSLAIVAIFALSVMLSFSRSALIALAFGSLFLWRQITPFMNIRRASRWEVFGWGGIAILFLLVLASRIIALFSWDYLSLLRRQGLNSIAVSMWMSSPVFGVGLSQFISKVDSFWHALGFARFVQPVHNIFLLVLVETGIIGFISGVGSAISVIWRSRKTISAELWGVWFIIVVTGMIDHYWWTLQSGLLMLFLTLGLSLSTMKASTARE